MMYIIETMQRDLTILSYQQILTIPDAEQIVTATHSFYVLHT